KLVEAAPLLLGCLRQESRDEDLPVGRIRAAPAQADHVDAGLGELAFLRGASALAPTLNEGAEKDEATDPFWVAHGVRDCERATLGKPDEAKLDPARGRRPRQRGRHPSRQTKTGKYPNPIAPTRARRKGRPEIDATARRANAAISGCSSHSRDG